MTLYLPSAGFGNSRVLVTAGGAGELMGFFYPRLDFARNIREAMPAVYVHDGPNSRLYWCFGDEWSKRQWFERKSNILHTELRHDHRGLLLSITDVVPPDCEGVARRLHLERTSVGPPVTLLHYFQMEAGDSPDRNAVQHWPDRDVVVQHFQDVVLGVAASPPPRVACGLARPNELSDIKRNLEAGKFDGGQQCIGRVDFCLSFDEQSDKAIDVVIGLAGAPSHEAAIAGARALVDVEFDTHITAAASRTHAILSNAPECSDDQFAAAYEQAGIVLHDLFDESTGAWVAAPEFDPGYRFSGGYGYCWPRDAAISAVTVARLGQPELPERFFAWAKKTQLDDGHWYQRYWLNGSPAPSWCVADDEIQLDQTCAMVHAAGVYARALGPKQPAFVNKYRGMIARAINAIVRHLDDQGLHRKASDLWECCHGTFTYTMGGVIAAIREARGVFECDNLPDETDLWNTTVLTFWDDNRGSWLRRLDPDGAPDATLDSSVLGLIEPWGVINLEHHADRQRAIATIKSVADGLAVETKHGPGILRFQNESYMGGGWGCVNTLWLAQCWLRLAETEHNAADRAHQISAARSLMRTAVAHANPVGQLPELVPNGVFPYWAAPHGWASSLLIDCVMRWEGIKSAGDTAPATMKPKKVPSPAQ